MDFQRLAGLQLERNPHLLSRDISYLAADVNAVRCLTQAAINVELFTIPLYMTTMYSIQGMHTITGKGNALYLGRRWPGITPTPNPQTANQQACNLIFSVFIQEMLHLQMAANIHNALSADVLDCQAKPADFNSPLLVNDNNGWTCYGPNKTIIPHILDLTDLSETPYNSVKVALGGLDENSINLFLLIEEPSDVLASRIKNSARGKYIATNSKGVEQSVPFENWNAQSTEAELPLFGTIATMYECLAAYLNITYSDGSNLFNYMFNPDAIQRDLFNTADKDKECSSHPFAEFPRMKTLVDAKEPNQAKNQIFKLMNAITDQGEGATMKVEAEPTLPADLVGAPVAQSYQPSFQALQADYKQYDEKGNELPMSGAAHARFFGGVVDHYDRFQQVKGLLASGEITTWADWHANTANKWQADDLQTAEYKNNQYSSVLPSAEVVSSALNNLKVGGDANWQEMSHVAAGAISGITTVLNKYWTDETVDFPFPSMSGSGDRVSICWAVFGKAPDLSLGEYQRIPESEREYLYHACQGMALQPNSDELGNSCASKEVFHTCRGSNSCKAEGGCGFVQKTSGGGSGCRSLSVTPKNAVQDGCDASGPYSPPADNACGGLGGCAVPISAAQLYPDSGLMPIYQLRAGSHPEQVSDECIQFATGDAVYDVAWQAYSKALAAEGKSAGDKPQPSDLRLAFPPST